MALLPQFSVAESVMQSVKAERLHDHFNAGGQVLNFAKALEEMGATQKGDTPEEREANTKLYASEALKTMIASRGLTDGNSLFALTNNSGGAAQKWDLRMATTVAPLLGDIMKHSKLGNADYMALKSYAGGGITSKAVQALVKYGLATAGPGGDAWEDPKHEWHLNANSKFAEGITENIWDWSRRILDELQEHGYDTHSQKAMNEIINEIGSNKSTTMMMRALLEPGTRAQMTKEMVLRDRVPNDAASVLQNNDPILKLDALHKKWDDFLAALGGPLVDPAMAALTKMTAVLNSLAQVMHDHPDLTKFGGETAGVAGLGLLGYGGGKMLGLWGGSDAGLGAAATQLDASAALLKDAAIALGAGGHGGIPPGASVPSVPGQKFDAVRIIANSVALFSLAEIAEQNHVFDDPKREGWRGVIEGLDPGLADRLFGKVDGSPVQALKIPGFISPAEAATRGFSPGTGMRTPGDQGLHQDEGFARGAQKVGELADKTGFVLTSFDGLDKGTLGLTGKFGGLDAGSAGLKNSLDILAATAIGAAWTLAQVAMSGGGSGGGFGDGGGCTKASWGGGGGDGSPIVGGAGTVAEGLPTEARAFLDTIASGEAHGYNILNGGGTFGDLSHHPGGRAAGRYQDLPNTWKRISAALGLHDFSPASQDKGNWWLAQQDYRAHTGRDLLGDLQSHDPARIAEIGRALHSTWVSTNGSFARKFDHFMGEQHRAPLPPPARKDSGVLHVKLHVDGKEMAAVVTRHQSRSAMFNAHPHYHDDSAHYAAPDSAFG